MSEHRFITATFSDDIRYEIGNKFSLIGCYSGELISDMMPIALPKLCASVSIHSKISDPFKKLAIRALLNDVVVAEQEIPEEALMQEDQLALFKKADFLRNFSVNIQFVFQPFVVETDSWLSIVAETETGIIQGPYFHIRGRTESEQIPTDVSLKRPILKPRKDTRGH